MGGKWLVLSVLLLGLMLGAIVGLSVAQSVESEGGAAPQASVGNGFTYQGRLADEDGHPVSDTCDLDFELWDAENGGALIGHQIVFGVGVKDGYLTVLINNGGELGERPFDGGARWLKIAVKCSADADWNVLPGRQPLSATPYAISLRPGAVISGTVTGRSVLAVINGEGGGSGLVGYSHDVTGVHGQSTNGMGLAGVSVNQVGIYGESTYNTGGFFTSTYGYGIGGSTTSDDPDIAAVEGVNLGAGRGIYGYGNGGPGGYFANQAGGTVLYAAGDAAQDATAAGLVKAAYFGSCGGTVGGIYRWFNTVADNIGASSNSSEAGKCTLYFSFDLSGRFWSAMAYDVTNAAMVSCILDAGDNSRLVCQLWDSDGNPANGEVMVLVY